MWIKASGTWLQHAEARDIFVPVAIDPLLAALERDDPACESCADFVRQRSEQHRASAVDRDDGACELCPQVVVHVHCIETISLAVREDAEAMLSPRSSRTSLGLHALSPARPAACQGNPRAPQGRHQCAHSRQSRLGRRGRDGRGSGGSCSATLCGALTRPARDATCRPRPRLDRLRPGQRLRCLARSWRASPGPRRGEPRPCAQGDALSRSYRLSRRRHRGRRAWRGARLGGASASASKAGQSPSSSWCRAKASFLPQRCDARDPRHGALPRRCGGQAAPHADPVRMLSREDELALVNWDAEKYRQSLPAA